MTPPLLSRAVVLPAIASLPALLYVRDQVGGLCRVRGGSMEPDLHDGDWLWVRKCDSGSLLRAAKATITGSDDDNNPRKDDDEERQRVVRYEMLQGITNHVGLLLARPPAVAAGDIVVYQLPTELNKEYLVKRCIGVGGMWVRQEHPADPYYKTNEAYQYRLQALPPFTVYVEGSNKEQSVDDSRKHGPISKNLVVGIAEYVVWPPTRWQRLRRTPQTVDQDGQQQRAVWY